MSTDLSNSNKKVCIKDEILLGNGTQGEVRFIGNVSGKNGVYYGLKLIKPKGKTNGCMGKIKYFQCKNNYGLFVKKTKLTKSKITTIKINVNIPRVIIGDRVLVMNKKITGSVRFIGPTAFKSGILYGIQLDDPAGDNNGTVNNHQYFNCENLYGIFSSGSNIKLLNNKEAVKKRKSSKKKKRISNKLQINTNMPANSVKSAKKKKIVSSPRPKSKKKSKARILSSPRPKPKPKKKATNSPKKKLKLKPRPISPKKKVKAKMRPAAPKKRKKIKIHNRYPSYIIEDRYQTESNRKRSLLLVCGYFHYAEINYLSSYFKVMNYSQNNGKYFNYNYNDNGNSNSNSIPSTIMNLCHKYLYSKIHINNFIVISMIGKGGFADVRLVHHKDEKQKYYAMKSLSKKIMIKKKQRKQIYLERDILINLNHWLIIKLFWSFQDKKYVHLVEEYCQCGDLMKILIDHDTLSEDDTRFYIAEISEVINYLHIHGYVHRDIKPDNILVHGTGHIKLCDLGSAAFYKPQDNDNEIVPKKSRKNKKLLFRVVGTPDYVSPEVLMKKGYGMECDWWAVGVIMFESLCGYPPFYAGSARQTCRNIIKYSSTLHMPVDADLSINAENCITKLLCSWQSRMNYTSIKKHPFFKNIDWNNLKSMIPPHPYQSDSPDASMGYDTCLGLLYNIDEHAQLHYTRTDRSMSVSSTGSSVTPNTPNINVNNGKKHKKKNSQQLLLRRRSSRHSRNHFKGFTFEGDDNYKKVVKSNKKLVKSNKKNKNKNKDKHEAKQ